MKILIIILLIILSFAAGAQVFTPQTAAGYQYKRTKSDSTDYIPTFCGVPNLRSTVAQKMGAIAFDSCNHRFYYYDPKTNVWDTIHAGGGGTGGGITQSQLNDTAFAIRSDFAPVVPTQPFDSISMNFNNTKYLYWSAGVLVDSALKGNANNLATNNLLQSSNRTYNGNGYSLKFNNISDFQLYTKDISGANDGDLYLTPGTTQLYSHSPGGHSAQYYGNDSTASLIALKTGALHVLSVTPSYVQITRYFDPSLVATLKIHTDNSSPADINNIAYFDPNDILKRGAIAFPAPAAETDPIWTGVSGNYRTFSQNNLLYAPLSHLHSTSDLISGILPIVRGGTGLGTIGTVGQSLRVASGGTTLEYYTPSGGVAQFNPIAGTNVTLSGTYPNITFNASGGGAVASIDSLKGYSAFTSGGATFGDSSSLTGSDSSIFYGASVEFGLNAGTPALRWTTLTAANLGTVEVNKSISGTTFQKVSTGDSSFIDRLYTIPRYRATERYIFIGASNIINEDNQNIGPSGLAAAVSRAIDTINLARGWPLNRIIFMSPSLTTNSAAVAPSVTHDSIAYYSNVALTAAKLKGVSYVDDFNYMAANGASTLLSSDSIHPNNAGHYQISQAITYRLWDVKINNSLKVNRNLVVKGTANIGGMLTLNATSGQTGNFAGELNFGFVQSGGLSYNKLNLLDAGSSALRAGLAYSSLTGQTILYGRTVAAGMMFGLGQDEQTLSAANSNFYLDNGTGTASANGKTTVFNGTSKFSAITATSLTASSLSLSSFVFPAGTNASGILNWGSVGGQQGIKTLDAGSAAVSAGLIYDAATTGNSFLFGRGSLPFMFGTGKDNTNMTTANAAFYINTSNRLTVNGGMILNAGTTAANTAPLKFTAGTNLTTTEAGALEYNGSHLYFTATNAGPRYQLDQQALQTPGVLTDGATITWNLALTTNDSVTLAGNRTLVITNPVAGMFGVLVVIQDATGSRTLTLPANAKVIGGGTGAITLTTTAGAKDILTFYYDGSFYYFNYGKNYN